MNRNKKYKGHTRVPEKESNEQPPRPTRGKRIKKALARLCRGRGRANKNEEESPTELLHYIPELEVAPLPYAAEDRREAAKQRSIAARKSRRIYLLMICLASRVAHATMGHEDV